jgi:hypothetical protein
MPFSIIIALSRLISSISSSKRLYAMHESSLDLFCNHENQKNEIDNAFDQALHELAEEQGVSVEYFIMEFM